MFKVYSENHFWQITLFMLLLHCLKKLWGKKCILDNTCCHEKWLFHFLTHNGCTKYVKLCLMNEWHHKLELGQKHSSVFSMIPQQQLLNRKHSYLCHIVFWVILKTSSGTKQWRATHIHPIWLTIPQSILAPIHRLMFLQFLK